MKRFIFSTLITLLCCGAFAQHKVYSDANGLCVALYAPGIEEFYARTARHNSPALKTGIALPLHFSSSQIAWIHHIRNGRSRFKIISEGAASIALYFKYIDLKQGSLRIFNAQNQLLSGPFTAEQYNGKLVIPSLPGDELILDFSSTDIQFEVEKIVHNYIPIPFYDVSQNTVSLNESGNCQVNVNCSEGDSRRAEIRSVVRIEALVQGILLHCSGALVNNTANDKRPYILTAMHCAETIKHQLIDSSEFADWVFIFNYTAPSCERPSDENGIDKKFINGCKVVANSNDSGGLKGSDFLLVELSKKIPDDYNAYYAGWNIENTAPETGHCVHHPMGDVKKISTYTVKAVSHSPGTSGKMTHWLVYWAATENGFGTTEIGSSGSPLFDEYGRITGTLTGGGSSCAHKLEPDFFGKLSYSWNQNGDDPGLQLKPWLDPLNTQQKTLNGLDGVNSINKTNLQTRLIEIFPNPASDYILVSDINNTNTRYDILDLTGKILIAFEVDASQQPQRVDISELAAGIYFLRNNQISTMGRLVIAK